MPLPGETHFEVVTRDRLQHFLVFSHFGILGFSNNIFGTNPDGLTVSIPIDSIDKLIVDTKAVVQEVAKPRKILRVKVKVENPPAPTLPDAAPASSYASDDGSAGKLIEQFETENNMAPGSFLNGAPPSPTASEYWRSSQESKFRVPVSPTQLTQDGLAEIPPVATAEADVGTEDLEVFDDNEAPVAPPAQTSPAETGPEALPAPPTSGGHSHPSAPEQPKLTVKYLLMMSFYDILAVDPGATPAVVRKAYGKLALKYHPDKGGDPEVFKYLTMVKDVLIDYEKRARYDANGKAEFVGPFTSQSGPASSANCDCSTDE